MLRAVPGPSLAREPKRTKSGPETLVPMLHSVASGGIFSWTPITGQEGGPGYESRQTCGLPGFRLRPGQDQPEAPLQKRRARPPHHLNSIRELYAQTPIPPLFEGKGIRK